MLALDFLLGRSIDDQDTRVVFNDEILVEIEDTPKFVELVAKIGEDWFSDMGDCSTAIGLAHAANGVDCHWTKKTLDELIEHIKENTDL